MDTFTNLEKKLEHFEAGQFAGISAASTSLLNSPVIHGGVQSVAMDSSTNLRPGRLPVVVAVGINYHQDSNGGVIPISFRRYLNASCGSPTVIEAIPAMRSATDFALDARRHNSLAWGKANEADGSIFPTKDYHLVAMNLSPFITTKSWSQLSAAQRTAILGAWNWQQHLDAFYAAFHSVVDVWIGHGVASVWPKFNSWRSTKRLSCWMNAYNLSGLGLSQMRRATKDAKHARHKLYR